MERLGVTVPQVLFGICTISLSTKKAHLYHQLLAVEIDRGLNFMNDKNDPGYTITPHGVATLRIESGGLLNIISSATARADANASHNGRQSRRACGDDCG